MRPLEPWSLPLDGTHLIEASAGTGKTYTIGTLVLRLVLEAGLGIDQVLVVTFTRAATAELRDRIRRRLVDALALVAAAEGDAQGTTRPRGVDDGRAEAVEATVVDSAADGLTRYLSARAAAGHAHADADALATALRDFDTAPIFTIHGFCQRVLQEFAFESGTSFEMTLVDDARALQREIVADYWALRTYRAPAALVRYVIDTARLTPPSLERLASALARARGIEVVPRPDDVDPSEGAGGPSGGGDAARLNPALAEWHAARTAARAALEAGRATVEALLVGDKALRHGSYSKRNVPRWLDQMDGWLRSDAQPPTAAAVEATLARFTPAHVAAQAKDGAEPPDHPFFSACERCQAADTALVDVMGAWARRLRLGLAPYLARETHLRRRRANAQSFDDLLHDLAAALGGDHGPTLAARARARYAAALIDEFQDTDHVQYGIFRTLFGAGDVVSAPHPPLLALIGDPKQAIYSFRGADVFAYLSAAEDAGPDRTWTLDRNRRSDQGLVDAVNTLWDEARADRPFVHPGIRFHPVGSHHPNRFGPPRGSQSAAGESAVRNPMASLSILRLSADDPGVELDASGRLIKRDWALRHVPRRVAADIARLLASAPTVPDAHDGRRRPLEPGDIAVLTRTNIQADAVQRALGRLGLPSVRHGDASVFDTDEADEIARVLAAVVEPGDARLVRGALATLMLGADAARLVALATDEAGWEAEVERFRGWLEAWQRSGFIQAFRRILDDADVAGRYLGLPDGERRLTNVQHLGELLHRAAHADGHGPRALVAWLARLRTDVAARAADGGDDAQIRLERDEMAIQVITVHRSKGLEYPVVYCPFLWSGSRGRASADDPVRFTDPVDRRPKLDIGDPPDADHQALADVERQAEDMRLAYVALTRARHHCAVVWGPIVGAEQSSLGRLLRPSPRADDGADDPAEVDPDLEALVDACCGALAVRPLAAGAHPPWRPAPASSSPSVARTLAQPIPRGRRRTSYSALTAGRREAGADADDDAAAEALRDHDADTEVAATDAPDVAIDPSSRVTLADFPAGADPGTCLHDVFEHIDFADADDAARWAEASTKACRRTGIDVDWGPRLPAALAEIVATRLGDGPTGFALRAIGKNSRLNEVPFVLPVAVGPSDDGPSLGGPRAAMPLGGTARARRHGFGPAELAAALSASGPHGLPPDYPAAVARLGFEAVTGHLGGFIDMVFRHADRWYIVDWKSNRLGPTWDDYTPRRLSGAMARHHYYLQYHLYTVAVHRYLARRLPGYAYADDFGGVFYLFVRGMHPSLGPARGVFFDRPPEARIARLDALLAGRDAP